MKTPLTQPMSVYYVDHAIYARKLAREGRFDEAYDALSNAVDMTERDDDEAMSFIDTAHAFIRSLEEYAKYAA